MMSGTQRVIMTATRAHSEPSALKSFYRTTLPTHTAPGASVPANLSQNQPDSPNTNHSSSPQIHFKPTYHITRPLRMLQDCFFKPRKLVMILGESGYIISSKALHQLQQTQRADQSEQAGLLRRRAMTSDRGAAAVGSIRKNNVFLEH